MDRATREEGGGVAGEEAKWTERREKEAVGSGQSDKLTGRSSSR